MVACLLIILRAQNPHLKDAGIPLPAILSLRPSPLISSLSPHSASLP